MNPSQFDVAPFLTQDEGQHFDRKSLFEGPPDGKRPRDRRVVRDQVAEYVAAFANAEGGVLILDIEDDKSVTGHGLPPSAVQALLAVPRSRLDPPQSEGFVVPVEGGELIVFDVTVSDAPVMVGGNGFPLRVGDQTVRVRESQIRALKRLNMHESWESEFSTCGVQNLDTGLLSRARRGAGLAASTNEEYLLLRKLADRHGSRIMLRRAAELLFRRGGADHANAGIRVFRVIGRERRTGAEYNVEEFPRIEDHLPGVLDKSLSVVRSLLRRPTRLVGTRFRPTPEYPDFAWSEAVLNAVEHRDYGIEGAGTEIWLYEDRMEVVSSGGLAGGLALDELLSLNRVHRARNPRVVRVLVDLGYARDQGEGVPRMFAEMEDAFLPLPEIEVVGQSVKVILRNTPTLNAADRDFLASIADAELKHLELRALLQARRRGRVDNAMLRSLSSLDTLAASRLLRGLRDRGMLRLHARGADSYYTLSGALGKPGSRSLSLFDVDRGELGADRGELGADRGELPPEIRQAIDGLGPRPRKEHIRQVIETICGSGEWTTPSQIAVMVRFKLRNLTSRHLSPMVDSGRLVRRYPDTPTHPRQAYRTSPSVRDRPPIAGGSS